jgi:hypothetical protein
VDPSEPHHEQPYASAIGLSAAATLFRIKPAPETTPGISIFAARARIWGARSDASDPLEVKIPFPSTIDTAVAMAIAAAYSRVIAGDYNTYNSEV